MTSIEEPISLRPPAPPTAPPTLHWSRIDSQLPYGLQAPQRAGDVGWDLQAAETLQIFPGEAKDVPTNVRLQIPEGYWAEIRARSSIARSNLQVDAGTIDPGYRGPLFALVRNMKQMSPEDAADEFWYVRNAVTIEEGTRIAQVVFHLCAAPFEPVELPDEQMDLTTERGEDGFGSTGQ